MSSYASLDEARQKALEARKKMLGVRPEEAIPPLPDSAIRDFTSCLHYFETAGQLYLLAAEAYAAGDIVAGHTYELWAYQYLLLGQTCQAQIAQP